MMLTVNRDTLEELLRHAAAAARIVGHLDVAVLDPVVGPLGDHIDAIAHDLSELLCDPGAAVVPKPGTDVGHQVVLNGVLKLRSAAGGTR